MITFYKDFVIGYKIFSFATQRQVELLINSNKTGNFIYFSAKFNNLLDIFAILLYHIDRVMLKIDQEDYMKKIFSLLMVVATLVSAMSVTALADEEKFATVEALQFGKGFEPTIDGVVSLSEWGTATLENVSYPENTQTDMKTSGKMEFSLWTRYNFEGFYLAITTPDNEHWNSNVVADNNSIWNGDCLQVRLDAYGCTVDQGKIPTSDRNGNWHSSYNEFAFALGNDGNTYAYSWHGVVDHEDISGGNGRYVVAHDSTKKLTTYELFIPWEVILQTPPHVGMSVGFSLSVNEGSSADGGGYKNYLEWGSGVMNGRDDNIYGSNRLNFVSTRATGGDELVDPNPENTLGKIEEVTEDAFAVKLEESMISGQNNVTTDLKDDGSLNVLLTGEDPYFTVTLDSKYKLTAENYRYVAMYLKTNDYNDPELFFATSKSPSISDQNYIPSEYQQVEGGQIVIFDFQYFIGYEWVGDVLKLRIDPVDEVTDTLTSEVTIYGIGFFNNLEDAAAFKVEGVNVELDPNYKAPEAEATEDQGNDNATQAPAEDEETDAATDDTATNAPASNAATTGSDDNKKDTNSSTPIIIIVIVAVVVIAAVAVVVIMKKKKA